MRASLGGSEFPSYRLLYQNAGDTLANTVPVPGAIGAEWTTDGESIHCSTTSVGQGQGLQLFTGLDSQMYVFSFDLLWPLGAPSTFTMMGLGLADSSDMVYSNEDSAMDLGISFGCDIYRSVQGLMTMYDEDGSPMQFVADEWSNVIFEYVGHRVGCYLNGRYGGSVSVVRSGYDSGQGGTIDSVRISYSRTSSNASAPRIKNIKVWGASIGEFMP